MRLHRRRIIEWTAGLLTLVMFPRRPKAIAYPTRAVHLVVGFPPGGIGDALARLLSSHLSARLGQQVLVEYRAGAGSLIATRHTISLPADGHTLLLIGSSTIVSALLREREQSDVLQSIVLVASLTVSALVIVATPSASRKTLADLVAFARTHPVTMRVGTYGVGTQSYLAARSFCLCAGIELVLVPYPGSAPMMNDLLGGHIDIAFDSVGSALPHIRSGAMLPLAVTAAKRIDRILPDVPAAAELFPGYEVITWTGLAVRRGTPPGLIDQLHRECMTVLGDPDVYMRLRNLAMETLRHGRDMLDDFWSEEVKRTRRQLGEIGIMP